MIAVAIDESADDVRPWVDGITMPVLLDREHVLTEVFAISNVPAVVWIDEAGRIARPTAVAFGSDMFKDFTGVDAEPHLEAVREWVRDGTEPSGATGAPETVADLSDATLHALVKRASALLKANLGEGPRITRTALSGPKFWAYGRRGRACFRCGGAIDMIRQGAPPGRSTYYCRGCQTIP